ncbi:hypothetical protein AU468_09770 [Alkalispirochaeta sphaeroplastigenens]|uniref:Type IV methyl-directed restriction enzyme EcoKMcrB subunit DNA-binding domain-containing protein n=1 Tax=Alkalispirochaeta sphaeroplastigenens TaxID=1187066 RepID=A0A2S4JL57_9SPIO|nr:DUF3578 domain-containing protein [Alkalispirochaeta sphaeroplastigenens]POR00268.1 hypothetical protein AU468_09770 [Alkalispirochaeta sphaeroplastigenens]
MNNLQQLLQEITGQWESAKNQPFTNHPLANKFRNEFVAAVKEIVSEVKPEFKINGSVGAGNWANVPWLSILDPDVTKTTQDGLYPVYLFKSDGSGVYLSLNQGTTIPAKKLGKRKAVQRARYFSEEAREKIKTSNSWSRGDINLLAKTPLGKSYEAPNIFSKYYPCENIPDHSVLKDDIFEILNIYENSKYLWINFNEKIGDSDSLMGKSIEMQRLSKPFVLMAGISGTGKTRFIRQQAELTGNLRETYCLIPVRPDWHDPSDLLGYISRLGQEGPCYVVSDFLRFIVRAWKDVVHEFSTINGRLDWVGRDLDNIRPFWLCLDEMNLAPVEQYFADFLAILETRKFLSEEELQCFNTDSNVERSYVYSSDSILKPEIFSQLDSQGLLKLRADLDLDESLFDSFWEYFRINGIPLPFNLIVAGTVNMDETTHGFSRKVIDRALTIDFGEFFPNDFDQFFEQRSEPIPLTYPCISSVTRSDLKDVDADPDGEKTVEFLTGINELLRGSPFELAYRALNELLLSVASHCPKNERDLMAVWDDFLMMKILPRVEGDQEKLSVFGADDVDLVEKNNILVNLGNFLERSMDKIWDDGRKDLFKTSIDDRSKELNVPCRSKNKIGWMRHRLLSNGFTSFWP